VSKGVAAAITGSGALLAETLHSLADCGHQLLLLLGVKRARKPADEQHPLGYGRDLYFWSFMVAVLLFLGGGMFSIYEGVHKLQQPEAVGSILVGVVVLAVAGAPTRRSRRPPARSRPPIPTSRPCCAS
jgi:divalent metal cation (Fe/Co/Zn/Cd) transporter